MSAKNKKRLAVFDSLAKSFRWAMGLIPEKCDGGISGKWYCAHCCSQGVSLLHQPVSHKPDCPWLQAKNILAELNDPEMECAK